MKTPGSTGVPDAILRGRGAVPALVFLCFLVTVALLAPLITAGPSGNGSSPSHSLVPFSPDQIDLASRLQAPSRVHWLGTDDLGRDVLARMIHGSRVSLFIASTATFCSAIVGIVLGALAGYYRGAADWLVSRLIEIVLCFPFLFLLLAIVALAGPSVGTIILALAITSWTSEARLVRGEFLRIRELEYAAAARASGARDGRIIFRHLLPNAIAPVLVSISFGVASAVLIESALSFLGFGVPLPQASWGSIMSAADEYMAYAWWMAVFPGLAIFLTMLSCNVLGERMRDVLDARTLPR